METQKDIVFLKQEAAKNLGYNYEIWVIDKTGVILQKYKLQLIIKSLTGLPPISARTLHEYRHRLVRRPYLL
jgi:hypothetical protein